ncbi:MAG: Jag N-terminal domain-containing protein [Clostridia bacterium]|nr:Jag N-terminal domain-containing protein [Clostridia bacterium]
MSRHEFTGKTTEEAISEGLRKLGCTISDVKVEVLEEGAKGLFGLFGSKEARVRFIMDDTKDDMLSAFSALTLDSYVDREEAAEKRRDRQQGQPGKPPRTDRAQALPAKPKQEKPQPEKARPEKVHPEEMRPGERPPKHKKSARPDKPGEPDKPRPAPGPAFTPAPLDKDQAPPVHDPATVQGRAQQFLQELTRMMNVPVQVDVQTDPEGNLFAQMIGDMQGILIGRRGETLDALQYLTSLLINKGRDDYIRVTLDTENYRAKREDSLRRLASRMASRATKTGRKVTMEPMNPYERRILHASLQGHPHVTTHSEGEEPNRHVVITLKEGAAAPHRPGR